VGTLAGRVRPRVRADGCGLGILAFRGVGPAASWHFESDFIEGQRLTETLPRKSVPLEDLDRGRMTGRRGDPLVPRDERSL
jgi:hypothetical protein